MYSHDERMKAINLYNKYQSINQSITAVIRELEYPSTGALKRWVKEYKETGIIHSEYSRQKWKYSEVQKMKAINHYFEYGKSYTRTVKILGYPTRPTLKGWVNEFAPETRKTRKSAINCTRQQKEEAVLAFCTRTESADKVAEDVGVTRQALYRWNEQLLGKEDNSRMPKKPKKQEVNELKDEVKQLQDEIYKLRMEKNILEKASELLKKEQGINLEFLTNREKTILNDALRENHKLKDLLIYVGIPKSSYSYHKAQLAAPDKYEKERKKIITIFKENFRRYGYRRIHQALKDDGVVLSEKVVRRIMAAEKLVAKTIKKKKYSSYAGEISPAVPNLIQRNFKAEIPNEKWLTDLTEFHILARKIYLSPMIDCFDDAVISWSIGTSPDANLVNSMLDNAISTLTNDDKPIVHSDRGAHYRWTGWINRMNKANLIRSMSKKGCSPDNSACEGFFGRLKNEFLYGISWKDIEIEEFINLLDEYINWYNNDRIKMSLGGMSPIKYRQILGSVA